MGTSKSRLATSSQKMIKAHLENKAKINLKARFKKMKSTHKSKLKQSIKFPILLQTRRQLQMHQKE